MLELLGACALPNAKPVDYSPAHSNAGNSSGICAEYGPLGARDMARFFALSTLVKYSGWFAAPVLRVAQNRGN